MIRRLALAALVAAMAAGAAYAQSGTAVSGAAAIQARKDILKTFGPVSRDLGQMLRGEAAFDLAKVQAGLRVLAEGSPRLPALFPADSQTGDTKALPAIWQEKDKFNAIFVKLEADAKAALAAVTNEATFRAEAPKVFANCGACHNPYRAR
jgi:cytochrome c556